jgi:O-antigen/teichoic acid export membrane protein
MKDRIINSILSQTLFIIISGIIALITVPILINMLGKVEYGAFELIASLMIITFLLEFGMGSTLVKYIPEHQDNPEDLKSFIWSYFYVKLSVTLIGMLVIIMIGYHFETLFKLENVKNVEELKFSVYIFAIGIFFSSLSTFLENILKGFVYFGYVNLSRIVSVLEFFLLFYAYYLLSNHYRLTTIALIWFTLRPLISIFNALLVFKKVKQLNLLIPTRFKYQSIQKTLKFLFGMSYITLVAQLYNNLPKIILGTLQGPIAVGYWGIMDRIQKPLLNIQSATLRPLIPILSDKKYRTLTKTTIFQASRLYYLMIAFLGMLIILHIDSLILLWIGEAFTEVATLIKVLLLPFIFPNVGVFLMMYYAKGKTKINSIYLSFNTSIGIGLSTLLLLYYNDLLLFVYAYTFTNIVLTLLLVFIYLKHFKLSYFDYFWEVMVPVQGVLFICFTVEHYFSHFFTISLLGLISSLLFYTLLYFLFTWMVIKDEDKKIIFSLKEKLKKQK